ncbi:hypothetical protein [Burkholderia sp. BCC1999]|uniref:hypothetical protein n=1 Tax=Burkholderia sp. BCC1999 TaxID=2817448 RepID=UPI002AC368D5|nr:hypothetical protein [Burkholderia sp. BCC1999]
MHESSIISNSNDDQLAARRELFEGIHYVREPLGNHPHRIHKAKSDPSLCYLTFPEGSGVRP